MIRLASQSPRRAELLRQIGVHFTSTPAAIDETPFAAEMPEDFVRRMACSKAAVVRRQFAELPVLGADTTVVLDGQMLGKPRDREDALQMLQRLSGRTHQVLTGVALQQTETAYLLSSSQVTFAQISAQAAARYWDTGEPADKAGGYAIQGYAAVFVQQIVGSYSGIMGLPLYETAQLLRSAKLLD